MRLSSNIPLISLAAAATASAGSSAPSTPQYIFSNPPDSETSTGFRIPTSYESAVLGRRILALTPLGTVATVFPGSSELGGMPHALMEYVADCEDDGNPTFLAINIASTFKNVRAGSNISLAQSWTPPYPPDKRIKSSSFPSSTTMSSNLVSRFLNWVGLATDDDLNAEEDGEQPYDPAPYSAANLPRFSLLGHIEKISPSSSSSSSKLAECFVAKHPDARYWLPGNRIHESEFVRLVVEKVYWIGGFGDRAYIGWIPVDEWRNVTRDEWQAVELPGERKGWKEWSTSSSLKQQVLEDL